jgi:hypothetical protein
MFNGGRDFAYVGLAFTENGCRMFNSGRDFAYVWLAFAENGG